MPSAPKRLLAVLLTCLPALILWGVSSCGRGAGGGSSGEGAESPDDPSSSRYTIAVIPKGTSHEFWKSIHAGARKAEKEIDAAGGVSVEIIWKGPATENDTQRQIELVKTFISRGVDGIVLAPLDKSALVAPVRTVRQAGIPVVIIDSGLDGKPGEDYVSYVATDNREGGVLAAKRLGEVLEGKGKVICLRYQVGSESTMQRERGFLETIAEEFPEIEIISEDQYAGATEEVAYEKAQNLLTRFKDRVDGIFCPNESSTAGMLDALRQAGKAGKVKFVGFDSSEKLVNALEKGEIDGLVLQNPIRMGYEGVKTMVEHLEGRKVPPVIDTGVVVVTPENLEDDAMKELHSPDLSKWLED